MLAVHVEGWLKLGLTERYDDPYSVAEGAARFAETGFHTLSQAFEPFGGFGIRSVIHWLAMAQRNRVTPYGEIVASPLRGRWMGNRGCLHRGHDIVRPWNGKRWIICALEFKGWIAPKWVPGRWTALFFHDEAIAFAAGHRPCALCRRADYRRYRDALGAAGADAIDARLHLERLDGRRKRLHAISWRDLPAGTFVEVDGAPYAVLADRLRHWMPQSGYGADRARPLHGLANVITPPASVDVLRAGYELQFQ